MLIKRSRTYQQFSLNMFVVISVYSICEIKETLQTNKNIFYLFRLNFETYENDNALLVLHQDV